MRVQGGVAPARRCTGWGHTADGAGAPNCVGGRCRVAGWRIPVTAAGRTHRNWKCAAVSSNAACGDNCSLIPPFWTHAYNSGFLYFILHGWTRSSEGWRTAFPGSGPTKLRHAHPRIHQPHRI